MPAMHRSAPVLSGYAPALPTPFGPDGTLDRAAFEHLCAWQIEAGAPALIVGTITGEAPTLSPTEHRVLIHIAVDVAQGRVPVVAGAGSNATARAIEMTHDAERLGADAVISVVPYYNKPGQAGLLAHFGAIRRSTGLPIILKDVPARSVVGLADATVAHLAEDSQIIGLLDATGDVTRPSRLRPRVRPGFLLLSGDDPSAFAFQALGGDGCVSAAATLLPMRCREISQALCQGDIVRAQKLASPIDQLAALLASAPDPVCIKYGLSRLLLMAPTVRLPLVELTLAEQARACAALREIRQLVPEAYRLRLDDDRRRVS
jgi:4-hydroxy-tetrahydrodipicolinate synthase